MYQMYICIIALFPKLSCKNQVFWVQMRTIYLKIRLERKNRGSCLSSHVLLNLNKLRKR